MSLSPNDVRSYEFSSKMRGYDKEEVDNFLEQVAQALEATKQENVKLSVELDTLRGQIANLKQHEDIIKNAAIDARRNADLTVAEAKKEGEQIKIRAKEEGEQLVRQRLQKIKDIEEQIKRAEQSRKNYLAKLRTLVSSHLDLVEKESEAEVRDVLASPSKSEPVSESEPPKPTSPDDITVTETEDVTSEKRESLAVVPDDEKSKVEEELRSTVQEEEPPAEPETAAETEPEDKVEQNESALNEALKQFDEVKEAHPPYVRDESEKPESTPSLASPTKKWAETTSRAEEPPPEFIAKKSEETQATPQPNQQPTQDPSETGSMEPNAILYEDQDVPEHNVTPPPANAKVDVEKEFDEIAAKFNEEMDKAENRDK